MKPDFIIGPPEDPYMLRWWVIPRNRYFNIYLHKILRDDYDGALHDHPWWNISLPLWRGYGEVIQEYPLMWVLSRGTSRAVAVKRDKTHGKTMEVPIWRYPLIPIFRRATDAHRLLVDKDKPCWSLFITGPVVREWGFLCPKGWTYWKDVVVPGKGGNTPKGCP